MSYPRSTMAPPEGWLALRCVQKYSVRPCGAMADELKISPGATRDMVTAAWVRRAAFPGGASAASRRIVRGGRVCPEPGPVILLGEAAYSIVRPFAVMDTDPAVCPGLGRHGHCLVWPVAVCTTPIAPGESALLSQNAVA